MSEEMIKQIKKLLFDYTEVYDDEPIFQGLELLIKDNYISKDKIRDKIKEIENRRIEEGQCELALHGFIREGKIDVLKELLEEG